MFGAHTRIHKILHIQLIANQLYMSYNVEYMCVYQTFHTKDRSWKRFQPEYQYEVYRSGVLHVSYV